MADRSSKHAHAYRAGIFGMLIFGALVHVMCCAVPFYYRKQYMISPESAVSEAMKTLARVTELYGIAAQLAFNYKTEQLTETDLADVDAVINGISVPATYNEALSGTLPEGITERNKTLELRADNSFRQYFNFDDANLERYTFKVNGTEVTPVKASTGRYYVQQQNIGSGALSDEYTFSVSDGTNTFTITSSALGYAYAYQEKGTDQSIIRLCKLLYLYSQAADVVFD